METFDEKEGIDVGLGKWEKFISCDDGTDDDDTEHQIANNSM